MLPVENIDQLKELIKNYKAVLVYFFSNQCAPCLALRPRIIDLIEKDFPLCKIAFIDSEKSAEIASSYGVFASPAIISFFEGKEHHRFSKYIGIHELNNTLSRPYKLIFKH